VEDHYELLAFFDRYDLPRGYRSLSRSINHCKPIDAWGYLLASSKNNEKLAKMLLEKRLKDIRYYFSLDLLERIPYEWRLPLLYVLVQDTIGWRNLKSTPTEEFLPQLAIAKTMIKRDEKGYSIRVAGEEDEEKQEEGAKERGKKEGGEKEGEEREGEEKEGEKRDQGTEHEEGATGEQT
jgi:hypothetical protein